MNEAPISCRYCGRPIAVPASTCPWCGRAIMVICSACKRYTDNQEPNCQHCGAPLVPATLERPAGSGIADERVAQLLADRARAKLVASGVVAQYLSGFFYASERYRTVLVDLFGPSPDHLRQAAALLFAATAYLVYHGYCAFHSAAEGAPPLWAERRPWDGQWISLEGMLARWAGLGLPFADALQQALQTEVERESPPPRRPVRTATTEGPSAAAVVLELARRTVLPEHRESEACRETYQMLRAFVAEAPARARWLAAEILDVLAGLQSR